MTNTLNSFDVGDVRATDVVIGFSHTAGIDQQASADVFPTMKAGHDTMPSVRASTVRRLTPLECERLQGFPDNWTAWRIDLKQYLKDGIGLVPQSDGARYKQMGNAVAVPVFEWVIGRLVAAHQSAPLARADEASRPMDVLVDVPDDSNYSDALPWTYASPEVKRGERA